MWKSRWMSWALFLRVDNLHRSVKYSPWCNRTAWLGLKNNPKLLLPLYVHFHAIFFFFYFDQISRSQWRWKIETESRTWIIVTRSHEMSLNLKFGNLIYLRVSNLQVLLVILILKSRFYSKKCGRDVLLKVACVMLDVHRCHIRLDRCSSSVLLYGVHRDHENYYCIRDGELRTTTSTFTQPLSSDMRAVGVFLTSVYPFTSICDVQHSSVTVH